MDEKPAEVIGKGTRKGTAGSSPKTMNRIDPFTGEAITYHYLNTARARRRGTEEDAIRTAKVRRRGILRKYRPVILSLLFVAMAGILVSRGAGRNGMVYREHLADVAVSMTGPDGMQIALTLNDLAYYVWKVERDGDVRAQAYDATDPKAYWNLYFNDAAGQSGYMSDLGRKAVVDYAVRDAIYVREAQAKGFTLTEEQEKEAVLEADRIFLDLSPKAAESLQFTRESLIGSVKKETLAREYMLYLYDNGQKDIDVGGAWYEALKAAYAVTEDADIIKGIRIGYVTIN
ncbi:MAG: hypothetical protein K6B69_05495 [Lachnospiraceae bacterium]|nr:hypothetical protein [Lachnospiraceae bacterium]